MGRGNPGLGIKGSEMNAIRLMLTEALLFAAWVICPKGLRHHVKVAGDLVHEDYLTAEIAKGWK